MHMYVYVKCQEMDKKTLKFEMQKKKNKESKNCSNYFF